MTLSDDEIDEAILMVDNVLTDQVDAPSSHTEDTFVWLTGRQRTTLMRLVWAEVDRVRQSGVGDRDDYPSYLLDLWKVL